MNEGTGAVEPQHVTQRTHAARPAADVRARAAAVAATAGLAAVLVGLVGFALASDWRLLLWAEFLLAPTAVVAIATAHLGHGWPAVVAGTLAVATHAETWLASLQGTIEGALLARRLDGIATWPFVGQNGTESLIVLGGVLALGAGVHLVAVRVGNRSSADRVGTA